MKIKYIDKNLPKVNYETTGSVGIDVYSREDITISPNKFAFVPLNVVVETPKGYMTALLPRSSLFKKKGLILANSVGVIDVDYSGDNDEIMACLYNMADHDVQIVKSERICQLILVQVGKVELEEVDSMNNENRGGFGSTDTK